jgi:hypothetical protein
MLQHWNLLCARELVRAGGVINARVFIFREDLFSFISSLRVHQGRFYFLNSSFI